MFAVRVAVLLQHGDNGRPVRQANLVRLDRFACRYELASGRNDANRGRAAHIDIAQSAGTDERYVHWRDPLAGRQQRTAFAVVRALRVNELTGLRCVSVLERCGAIRYGYSFDRDDAIGALGQRGACHDFDAVVVFERLLLVAGCLGRLNRKLPGAGLVVAEGNGNAIHHDAVERWLVAFGNDALSQHASDSRTGRD